MYCCLHYVDACLPNQSSQLFVSVVNVYFNQHTNIKRGVFLYPKVQLSERYSVGGRNGPSGKCDVPLFNYKRHKLIIISQYRQIDGLNLYGILGCAIFQDQQGPWFKSQLVASLSGEAHF